MTFEEIRAAIEAARPSRLPAIELEVCRASVAGAIDGEQLDALVSLIAARHAQVEAAPGVEAAPVVKRIASRVGSRPRSPESRDRRTQWVLAGYLPPRLGRGFTHGELAALSAVAAEVIKHGDCRLPLEQIAALAGVARSTVKRALAAARLRGLVSVTHRRVSRCRNLPNVVTVIADDWTGWLGLRARRLGGAGVQTRPGTNTSDLPSPTKGRHTQGRATGAVLVSRGARSPEPTTSRDRGRGTGRRGLDAAGS